MYLQVQVSQFNRYSHELVRTIFEELTQILRSIIDSTRSAVQVWKLRTVGLAIVEKIILIYKLEGYEELATGIIAALIDFNFFMPDTAVTLDNQARVNQFGLYWEHQNYFKLAEVQGLTGWKFA